MFHSHIKTAVCLCKENPIGPFHCRESSFNAQAQRRRRKGPVGCNSRDQNLRCSALLGIIRPETASIMSINAEKPHLDHYRLELISARVGLAISLFSAS